jgi:hypothetical protein
MDKGGKYAYHSQLEKRVEIVVPKCWQGMAGSGMPLWSGFGGICLARVATGNQ